MYSRIWDGHIIVSLRLLSTIYVCEGTMQKIWKIGSRILLRKTFLFQTFCLRTFWCPYPRISLPFIPLNNYSYDKDTHCPESRHYLFTESFKLGKSFMEWEGGTLHSSCLLGASNVHGQKRAQSVATLHRLISSNSAMITVKLQMPVCAIALKLHSTFPQGEISCSEILLFYIF